MEVHKHPHHVTHTKKWFEYLLEFLMLFLAVYLGFVAENIRENNIENKKEKEYMISLVRDLEADRENLKDRIASKTQTLNYCDSLIKLFENHEYKNKTADIYYLGRVLNFRYFFYLTDGTLQQLRNAGGFRLIHHSNIVDSIQSYLYLFNNLNQAQQLEESQVQDYRHSSSDVFDVFVYDKMFPDKHLLQPIRPTGNPSLLSEKKENINILLMTVHTRERNINYQFNLFNQLYSTATSLIRSIKKEYSLKSE